MNIASGDDSINVQAGTGSTINVGMRYLSSRRAPSIHPPLNLLPTAIHDRSQIVDRLTSYIVEPPGLVQVLAGIGGVGKTLIALRLAELGIERSREVFWVRAASTEIELSMVAVAARLGASPSELESVLNGTRNGADLVWQYLNQAREPWLLIVDNADSPELLGGGDPVAGGAGWVRTTGSGLVIVTSRVRAPSVWGKRLAAVHEIRPLSNADGAALLFGLSGPQAGSLSQAEALAARLGNLPLALRAAALNITNPLSYTPDFQAYLSVLTTNPNEGIALLSEDTSPVAHTWETSLNDLARRGLTEAKTLMQLFSHLAPSPFPWTLAGDRSQLTAVRALHDLGLVDAVVSANKKDVPLLAVHPLVQECTRFLATPEEQDYSFVTVSASLADLIPEQSGPPSLWNSWQVLVPHLSALLTNSVEVSNESRLDVLRAAVSMAKLLIEVGDLRTCAEILNQALTIMRADRVSATVEFELRRLLAMLHEHQASLRDAEMVYTQLIDDQTKEFGEVHLELLKNRVYLAGIKRRLGDTAAAERLLSSSIPQLASLDREAHVYSLMMLAVTRCSEGNARESESMCREILKIISESLPSDHPYLDTTLHMLAGTLIGEASKEEEVIHLLKRTLLLRRKRLTEGHPHILSVRYDVAMLRGRLDGLGAIAEELEDIHRLYLQVLPETHPDVEAVGQAVCAARANTIEDGD